MNATIALADRIAAASMKVAFGEPESMAGAVVRPVALAAYGFGSGGQGAGGGGGYSVPLGMYVTEGGRTRFRPGPIALFLGGLGVLLAAEGVATVVRAFRRI